MPKFRSKDGQRYDAYLADGSSVTVGAEPTEVTAEQAKELRQQPWAEEVKAKGGRRRKDEDE